MNALPFRFVALALVAIAVAGGQIAYAQEQVASDLGAEKDLYQDR